MNILNKLTIKHLKMNKRRTIVSIIGIILSTSLMVGIGLLMSTMRDNMIEMIVNEKGGQQVTFYNLNKSEYEHIKKSDKVDKVFTSQSLGYARYENEYLEENIYLKVLGVDSNLLETFSLSEGRLPKNDHEILISRDHYLNYEIGDTLTLEIGKRSFNGELIGDTDYLANEEEVILTNTQTVTYQVVGILKYNVYQNCDDVGTFVYTYHNGLDDSNIDSYVYFHKIRDTRQNVSTFIKELNLDASTQVSINESLLDLYGTSRYSNFMSAIVRSLITILVILSIACAIVIYNSFAISVMERKKQFGLLSSIGTTKRQIRKTVFFEAFVVGTTGIILGILGAYVGIGTVLAIINHLLPDVFGSGGALRLVTYPLFIIIPILFMIVTILVSAFLPARSASRITPIEAIRLNDDIKIKGKKVKTPKFIRKIFGMEGEIALKNIKRNKKKYRITILSLFISIVLFISFSGYMKYMFSGIDSYASLPQFDAMISINPSQGSLYNENILAFRKDITKHKDVDEVFSYNLFTLGTTVDFSNPIYYNDKFYELERKDSSFEGFETVAVLEVEEDTYQNMLKVIGKNEMKPIIYNHYETIKYSKNTRKSYSIQKYSSHFNPKLNLCETIYEEEKESYNCKYEIDDYYVADMDFFGKDTILYNNYITMIVPMNYFGDLTEFNDGIDTSILLNIDNDEHLKVDLDKLSEKYSVSYDYINIKDSYTLTMNLVFCVKLLVYGFITLVTLIGVTSVFNTINTSIHLRRKEFAMLRSMGLSNKGFHKMLALECIFFGLKSLLYALPVSGGVIYLLYLSFKDMMDFDMMLIPYGSILIAIIGVFVIIIISTFYATRKIRKENILEAIREENI